MADYPGIKDSDLGENVRIFRPDLVNIYGAKIGDNTTIGPFVEIQRGVDIGKNCKIQSHTFLCDGVVLYDGVFVGHGVMFINDRFPRSVNEKGELKNADDWTLEKIIVKEGASIGSGSTILCGITIGEYALVGAGAVVTKDVEPYSIVVGNPARFLRYLKEEKK